MHIVILITASSKEEAQKIAQALVAQKLAACVNIMEHISSVFWWEGKIDTACESLLVVKSTKVKFGRIVKAVKALHSYAVPEIIALPIVAGEQQYLRWLDESLR